MWNETRLVKLLEKYGANYEEKNVIAENGRKWKIEKSALVLVAVHPADPCTDLADRFCLLSNVRPDHRL